MTKKKQIPVRLSQKLYEELVIWAEDDFRSVNGQIEFLLTQCVRQRKKAKIKNSVEETLMMVEEDKNED